MRKLFSRQLIEARHEMLSIYEAVDLAPGSYTHLTLPPNA